jgi:hypothetical protein
MTQASVTCRTAERAWEARRCPERWTPGLHVSAERMTCSSSGEHSLGTLQTARVGTLPGLVLPEGLCQTKHLPTGTGPLLTAHPQAAKESLCERGMFPVYTQGGWLPRPAKPHHPQQDGLAIRVTQHSGT